MFLDVKLQRLYKSHHLQCITSSKDSEKLEKSLCVRDKAEDLCWMPVVFGALDDTASLIDRILSFDITKWAQEYFQKPLSVNTICQCHLQMPTKFISCKKEAICEHGSDVLSCPVGQGSFKMDFQSGNVFYGQTSPNLTFLLEITDGGVLRAKEEGGLPTCYQHSVQKPASLMVWGCISGYGICSLRVLEGTMNAERYIKVLEQHQLPRLMIISEKALFISAGQYKTTYCSY